MLQISYNKTAFDQNNEIMRFRKNKINGILINRYLAVVREIKVHLYFYFTL
jgi:hypothetical protein